MPRPAQRNEALIKKENKVMKNLSKFLCILLVVTGTVAGSKKTAAPCQLDNPNYSENMKTLNEMAEEISWAGKEKIPLWKHLFNLSVTMKRVINIVKCTTGIGDDARRLLLIELINISPAIVLLYNTKDKARPQLISELRKKAANLKKTQAKFHPFKRYLSDSATAIALKEGVEKISDAWDKALSNWEKK